MGKVYWVIQELLLADLAKTQYKQNTIQTKYQKHNDDERPYSCISLYQHR